MHVRSVILVSVEQNVVFIVSCFLFFQSFKLSENCCSLWKYNRTVDKCQDPFILHGPFVWWRVICGKVHRTWEVYQIFIHYFLSLDRNLLKITARNPELPSKFQRNLFEYICLYNSTYFQWCSVTKKKPGVGKVRPQWKEVKCSRCYGRK